MKLFDYIKQNHDIKNDRHLAKSLGVGQPAISRISTGKQKPSAEIILRIHETFGIPVKDIREMVAE